MRDKLTLLITKHKAKMRQEEKTPWNLTRRDRTWPSTRKNNRQREVGKRKKLRAKKQEKEKEAAGEEHRQSAMERLGQTVKKHFEHFVRISFVYTRNSSSTASVRLTLEFSRRERRSLPSPYTAQLVVVVSFFVVYLKKCCLHIMTLSVCRL